ncbi:MAG: isopentenyl phosphate kinase [bacterium]
MAKKLLLLKIGGGVITNKTKRYGLLEDVLVQLAREIADGYEQLKDTDLIIGNGAGSFAHYSAHEYRTAEGFVDERSKIGAGWVRFDAIKLNQLVFAELLRVGVPVFSFAPSSLMTVDNGKAEHVCMDVIESALEKGMVPLVYGDVMIDKTKGCGIFSTEMVFDQLARRLVEKYEEVRVIHVSSEDGVYKHSKCKKHGARVDADEVVELITNDNLDKVTSLINGSHGIDVTGGMLHKVQECLELAKLGIKSLIVSGLVEARVKEAMVGVKVLGTRIE